MASLQRSSKSPTIRRILREAAEITNSPSPDYSAEPLEADLFEWHFTLRGPPNSVFSEGIYHGRITLPNTYPLRPPNFRFTTPNGRFEVNREICLSISGHHEETWQPAWGIRTAIVALRSFMETDAKGQLGGLDTPEATRLQLAVKSGAFICPVCTKSNLEIIQASGDRAAELNCAEEVVELPTELSFGWKDELEKKTKSVPRQSGDQQENAEQEDAETGDLAEGFIQTTPVLEMPNESEVVRPRMVARTAPAISGRHLPHPAPQARDDEVPRWIDRAIVGLSIMLLFLLCKVLFMS